jgi:hypothetical protein
MNTTQTVDELRQARAHHTGSLNLLPAARKNWAEAIHWGGEYSEVTLMQQAYALDDEMAMSGKPMPGAA